jgi:hypothetical protein
MKNFSLHTAQIAVFATIFVVNEEINHADWLTTDGRFIIVYYIGYFDGAVM